jgi:predicted RNA-binding protein
MSGLRSKFYTHSLVGAENEIIPPDEWDLPAFDNKSEMITHEHTEKAHLYILENHVKLGDLLLLTNCASRKPYTTAKTISAIHAMVSNVKDRIDIAVISSLGIIPIEYERHYPFAHYAWDYDDSEDARRMYLKHIAQRIKNFIVTFEYKWVVGVFRVNSKGKLSLKKACDDIPAVTLYEIPSWRTFDKIKHNSMKMTAYQTTNMEAKQEVREVVMTLLNGGDPGERISPTKEERARLIKERAKEVEERRDKPADFSEFL